MKAVTAFRVSWAPNTMRANLRPTLVLCSACNETWILRDPSNHAHFSGSPVPMTAAEVDALEGKDCGACGRSVLVVVPLNPFTAARVDDAERRENADYWALNDMALDAMDVEPL